jgi:hypothetical protein
VEHNEQLDELQWHWGSAYIIASPEPGRWIAQRRDDGQALVADTPDRLRGLIAADYAARPVPRLPE